MTSRTLLLLILIIVANVSSQQQYTAEEVMEKVRKLYSGLADVTAQFEQKVSARFSRQEQIQTGIAKVKKGNKYLIQTKDQTLISNGKTVWVVSQSNNQVLIDSYKENYRMFSPDKFLTGLPDDFLPVAIDDNDSLIKITLEPKKINAQTRQVKSLTVWIHQNNWIVKKIEYIDRNQTKISIALTKITMNAGLSDNEFEFEPSVDTKVIDMRKFK